MNIRFKLLAGLIILSFVWTSQVNAQSEYEESEIEAHKKKVEQLVSFFTYVVNTIGDTRTPEKERETIITESYLKAFRDNKVQIEDDLDESREVVINKDVQAYLKDIHFFFKTAKFEFNIEDISHFVNSDNTLFFKVSLSRNLNGETIDGVTINNNQPRYIEVNLNEKTQDLKIVSIYTSKLSIEEDLKNWWEDLSYEWQSIFKKQLAIVGDNLNFDQLKQITELKEINLENNRYIQNIDPVSKIYALRALNMANTQVSSLFPLRNLSNLEKLNCASTKIDNITHLKYAIGLKELALDHTSINDLSILENMENLERLMINNTPVEDLESIGNAIQLKELQLSGSKVFDLQPLKKLTNLESLDLSQTPVKNLTGLEGLGKLMTLNFSTTGISDLSPLKGAAALKEIVADHTMISSLEPLKSISSLERIYCDHTNVTDSEADQFNEDRKEVLIIHKSGDMESWWKGLSFHWKSAFRKIIDFTSDPSKDQLAAISNLTELDVSGLNIVSLEALRELKKLKILNCNNTTITELEPVKALKDLEQINASRTSVKSTEALTSLANLKVINIDRTLVTSIEPLIPLKKINLLSCDETQIPAAEIENFKKLKPGCLVIYNSEDIKSWWNNLTPNWTRIFKDHLKITKSPNRIQLQEIINLEKVIIENDNDIQGLVPLQKLTNLKELKVINSSVSSLEFIKGLKKLEVLQISKSPVETLEPIRNLTRIQSLDISDTPIDDLEPITILTDLRDLKLSGTQVKSIRPLSYLINLKKLELDNTNVSSLLPIEDLFSLEQLICYNTKLNKKKIERFREANANCKVTFY